MRKQICVFPYTSLIGEIHLGSIGEKLCLCDWADGWHQTTIHRRLEKMLNATFIPGVSAVIETAINQLNEYFAKKREFFDLPLLVVGTSFQKKVWEIVANIPYGKTISYAEEARKLNKPTALRAVANANGANALSLIIPCHRVVSSENGIGGYGGGVKRKRFLLDLEGGVSSDLPAHF